MTARSERAAPEIEAYWGQGSTFPNFLCRCADGELIQVYSDQMTGKLGIRAARWTSFFATQPRDFWVRRLREAGVACEPVLAPASCGPTRT